MRETLQHIFDQPRLRPRVALDYLHALAQLGPGQAPPCVEFPPNRESR